MGKGVVMKRIIALLIVLFVFIGCVSSYKAFYNISLDSVERPQDARARYGEQTITKINGDSIKYSFSDDLVDITWYPTNDGFFFDLTNKTNHSIKIIWDEAVYINEDGQSKGVIHSGVKYADVSVSQAPSVIARGTKISDLVFPKDNITWSSYSGSWVETPLFENIDPSIITITTKARKYIGKSVQVLLPLQIETIVNEYIFIFKIDDFEVKEGYYYDGWHVKP